MECQNDCKWSIRKDTEGDGRDVHYQNIRMAGPMKTTENVSNSKPKRHKYEAATDPSISLLNVYHFYTVWNGK